MITLDQFVKEIYPEPTELEPKYNIFVSWGYDQYLIARFGKSFEQLLILHKNEYERYKLLVVLGDESKSVEEKLKGLPIIRAKKQLVSTFWRTAIGEYGIYIEGLCWFPHGGLTDVIGEFDEIEFTDILFESEQQLRDLNKSNPHPRHGGDLEDQYVTFPDVDGVWYVKNAKAMSIGHTNHYWITAFPTKDGKRIKGSKKQSFRTDRFGETAIIK